MRSEIKTQEQLDELLKERNLSLATLIDFFSDNAEDAQEIARICAKYIGDRNWQAVPALGEGQVVEAEMRAMVTVPYLQAIAKIAFHFVLKHFPAFSGTETAFDGIKRFIYHGGDARPFVSPTSEQFLQAFTRGGMLKTWGHLVTAQYDYRRIEARMQFFAGPRVLPLVWSVQIGRNPLHIIHGDQKGYAFLYYDQEQDGYHGEMVELTANARVTVTPHHAAFRPRAR